MEVYTLVTHYLEDGENVISLHTTREGATQELAKWVYELWAEMEIDKEPSGDSDTDINYFFEFWAESFYYDIQLRVVRGPEVADEGPPERPLGPDEVILNPLEIKAAVFALGGTACSRMGAELGLSPDLAYALQKDVMNKLEN